MNYPVEQPQERTSISFDELQAYGFTFDTDPLAAANAQVAMNFFFMRPKTGSTPLLTLSIARHLTKANEWNVSLYIGACRITDTFLRRADESRVVGPNEILPTLASLVEKIDARFGGRQIHAIRTDAAVATKGVLP